MELSGHLVDLVDGKLVPADLSARWQRVVAQPTASALQPHSPDGRDAGTDELHSTTRVRRTRPDIGVVTPADERTTADRSRRLILERWRGRILLGLSPAAASRRQSQNF